VSGVWQTGFINAFAIESRGVDRLLTRAARIAHGMTPNPSRARKRAVDIGNSTAPAKMKSAPHISNGLSSMRELCCPRRLCYRRSIK
jgi:hypothetical protein